MGGSGSKDKAVKVDPEVAKQFDWGMPPHNPPEDEQDIGELVLQTWAQCKAKPNPKGMYRSDAEERQRRESLLWRKRSSFIELDCGEDSFFVSNTYKTIGVADGVGGWRDEGIDASEFSNTLMQYAKLFSETHRKVLDPETIVQHAYDRMKAEKAVKAGGSTVCVASLRQDAATRKYHLDVMNLGDSGCLVMRNRKMIFRAHEKVHGFNSPFQLSILPTHLQGKAYCDTVGDAVRESVQVQEGDVVILGTDGLFDNRFNSVLCEDAGWVGRVDESMFDNVPIIGPFLKQAMGANYKIEYVDPYRVTQRQVAEAFKVSISKDADSPWSNMLHEFGIPDAKGGKVDDITCMIAKVTSREELRRVSMW